MAKIAAASFVATLAVLGLADRALSQNIPCEDRDEYIQRMENLGASIVFKGAAEHGTKFELWSDDAGNFAVGIVHPNGLMICTPLTGNQGYFIDPQPAGLEI